MIATLAMLFIAMVVVLVGLAIWAIIVINIDRL